MSRESLPSTAAPDNYSAHSIEVLDSRKAVQTRPSMHIGDVNFKGLHHLVYEAVDNCVDEAMAGYCSEINVTIHENNAISVEDNGRGIPTDIHPKENRSALEVVLTVLHAGGKFDKNSYKVSGGLHGVGISCVNFLSTEFQATIYREGKIFYQAYQKGLPLDKVKIIGESHQQGTKIYFKPDSTIFTTTTYNHQTIANRLRELAYLNPNVRFHLEDLREAEPIKESFYSKEGLSEFVAYLDKGREHLIPKPLYVQDQKGDILIEVALNYGHHFSENVVSYVNNINTIEGGTHVAGFRRALTRTMKQYADKSGLLERAKIALSGEHFREGLTAIIHVKIGDPQFEGQTKTKLGNSEVIGAVDRSLSKVLETFLEEHPKEATAIVKKAILTAQASQAAQKARELIQKQKGNLGFSVSPGKLAGCTERDPAQSELCIVEGKSAGGSAKQARNRYFQAILCLRGKILNTEKAQPYKIYENEQIRNIMAALNVHFSNDAEGEAYLNLSKLRYHKIIIMTDADVDGSHIRILILTFFLRYMPDLIHKGYVYFALPPLFRVRQGKEKVYCWTEQERNRISISFKEKSASPIVISRYKGLGEMNPDQLWDTTLDPQVRKLKQVTIQSAAQADRLCSILMGGDVQPRKDFIYEFAIKAHLDI